MNQILITKKLYVTPELKKKKKIYKFNFFLSVFFVCILASLYIYAEYDRNKSEEVSQEILANMDIKKEDSTTVKDNVLVVVLSDTEEDNAVQEKPKTQLAVQKTSSGFEYTTIATINIPSLNINYPILSGATGNTEETEALLKISPCKFWGAEPNEAGNFCIVGHNYRNKKFFSKVPNLVNGDIIEITDMTGRTLKYEVYNKYTVVPTDVSCTSQLTKGKKEITLITCTDDSEQRVIIKAREIK